MAAIYSLDLQAGTLSALHEPYTFTVHSFTTPFPSHYLNLLTTHSLSSHLLSSPLISPHPLISCSVFSSPVPLRDISLIDAIFSGIFWSPNLDGTPLTTKRLGNPQNTLSSYSARFQKPIKMLLRLLPRPTPSTPSPLTILFTLSVPSHPYT